VSKQNILSAGISLIPLSYILGTFVLNINILFIIISGFIIFYQGNRFKLIPLDKLIFLFFAYTIFTGTWNTIEGFYFENIKNYDFTISIKTLLFLRYLFFYLTIRLLIEKKLINYKIIFYSFSALSLFVSLDVILQFFNGKDIFGLTSPYLYRTTGPFYTEAIAGGFIQKFSFFLFFSFILFTKIKNLRTNIIILTILFFITFLSILLSGNRMPLLLFSFGIFLIFLNNKTLKKYIFHILILVFLLSAITVGSNNKLKGYYDTFYISSKNIISLYSYRILGIGEDLDIIHRPFYIHEFDTGVGTWKMNKYLGGGIKSFRYNCPKREIKSKHERIKCNMHPHNYYLEILVDLGIIGFLIFITIVVKTLRESFKSTSLDNIKYIISPFYYVFLIEVFPIRSSGSFFTTNNAVIIFLVLASVIGLTESLKKNK